MSDEAGFEVASAYVTLTIDDQAFADQVTESIENACSEGGSAGGSVLVQQLEKAASEGGDELSATLVESVSGSGETMAAEIGDGLVTGLSDAAAKSADEITAGLDSVAGEAAAAGEKAGAEFGDGLVTGNGAAAEELLAQISEALAAGTDEMDALAQELMQQLADTGKDGGYAFGSGFTVTAKTTTSTGIAAMAPTLAEAAIGVGAIAGAQLATAVGAGAAGRAEGGLANFADALTEAGISDGEQAGAAAGNAFAAAFQRSASTGVDLIAEGLSTAGQPMAESAGPSVQEQLAQEAAAAEQQLEESLAVDEAMLQTGIDDFTAMSGAGLRAWMAEVETAAMSASDAFISVYSSVQEQLSATTALTDEQANALEYLYTQARGEMDSLQAEATAFNSSIKELDFTPSSMLANMNPMAAISSEEISQTVAGFENTAVAAADVEKATSSASHSMGMFGGAMGGVGMQAIWMGSMALPYVSSAVSKLWDAFKPLPAVTLDMTNLATALSTDGNVAGDATAAFVATSSVTDGMSASAQRAGVSLATWTEAVMGNSAAQQQVTAAVELLNQKQQDQTQTQTQAAGATSKAAFELQGANKASADYAAQTNQLTDANQQLLASMAAQNQQITSSIQKQTQLDQATQVLDAQTQIFNATLDGLYAKEQLTAQQSAMSSVAMLHLGDAQSSANQQLVAAEQAFTMAQQGASAYTTALTALFGQYGSATDAQATFTTDLAGLTGTIKSGSDAVDVNTKAGAANVAAFYQVSQQAITTAEAIYQQTNNSQQATTALQHMATQLDAAATKAGLTKTQVQQLNQELFGVKQASDITLTFNSSSLTGAINEVNQLSGALSAVMAADSAMSGTVGSSASALLHTLGHRAAGGPVQAGMPYLVGEKGPELVVPQHSGTVIPADQTAQALGGVNVTQVFHARPSVEDAWQMKRELVGALAGAVGAI